MDRTINRLDKHEEIRYPDPSLGAIGVNIGWSGEPGTVLLKPSDEHAEFLTHGRI